MSPTSFPGLRTASLNPCCRYYRRLLPPPSDKPLADKPVADKPVADTPVAVADRLADLPISAVHRRRPLICSAPPQSCASPPLSLVCCTSCYTMPSCTFSPPLLGRRSPSFSLPLFVALLFLVLCTTVTTGTPVAVRADDGEDSSATAVTAAPVKAAPAEKETSEEKVADDNAETEAETGGKDVDGDEENSTKAKEDGEKEGKEEEEKEEKEDEEDEEEKEEEEEEEKEVDPDILAAQKKKAAEANAAARGDEDEDEDEKEDKDEKSSSKKTKKDVDVDVDEDRTDVFDSTDDFQDDKTGAVFEGAAKNADPSEDSKCFPADARVTLADGSMRSVEQLNIGDRVHVGEGVFSHVFMFTHKDADRISPFIRLRTAAGPVVSVTSGHYMPISGKGLVAAGTISVGDSLFLADSHHPSPVISIDLVALRGLYNPQTLHGHIAVDGVVASTYTTAVAPTFAHAVLAPFRALFRLLGSSTSALESGAGQFSKLLPRAPSVVAAGEL